MMMVVAQIITFGMYIFVAPDHFNKVDSSSSNVVTGLVFVRKLYQTYTNSLVKADSFYTNFANTTF